MEATKWLTLATALWQGHESARLQGALHALIVRVQQREQYQNDPQSDFGQRQIKSIESALGAVFGG